MWALWNRQSVCSTISSLLITYSIWYIELLSLWSWVFISYVISVMTCGPADRKKCPRHMNGDLPDRRPWLLSNNFQWGIPIKPINSRPRLKVDLEVELEFLTARYERPHECRDRSNQDRHGQFISRSRGSVDGVWPWRPGWALTWSALDNCSVVE